MPQLWKGLQPLGCPLLRSIRPRPGPLGPAPWVAENDEPLAVHLSDSKYSICMGAVETLHYRSSPRLVFGSFNWIKSACKESVLVNFTEFLFPELVSVEDVLVARVSTHWNTAGYEETATHSSVQVESHTTSEIFDRLSCLSALDVGVATIQLCVSLLDEGYPCLLSGSSLSIDQGLTTLPCNLVEELFVAMIDVLRLLVQRLPLGDVNKEQARNTWDI